MGDLTMADRQCPFCAEAIKAAALIYIADGYDVC
jgi:hypothetical protein